MKRKYYLRGLGVGILITAIVFILVSPSEMTDAEVIKRAEELGYVKAEEEDATPTISLKDLLGTGTPTPSPVPTEIVTPEPDTTETPEETITTVPTVEPVATVAPTSTPVPTEAVTPELTMVPENAVITAQILVERGNTARIVCEKIQAAGIVSDGNALMNYIVRNGFADYINIGTYTLSSDMTYEEITKIVTGR